MIKKILINSIITFSLCFLVHNVYKWLPNNLIAIFFPVNESIWEHMKMLFTVFIISGAIFYFLFHYKNVVISSFICGILSIIFYLIMFLPFDTESMIIIFTILIIDIIVCEYIRLLIIKNNNINKYNKLAYILIIITYTIFGYLTFKPIKCKLFKDTIENKYGINTYII
ncbi:MAG: hypothetical protein IKN63_04910 [Bacilli bacterium]|nr:hypothetical protein [Bacilli bacterium]